MSLKSRFNYFDAFEKQVDLACQEAELLIEIIENFTTSDAVLPEIKRAHAIEHAGDEVCHEVFEALAVDFITPIEREDIIAMTQGLDDVIDYMESTIQRFYMYNVPSMHPRVVEFARLLLKSCEALKAAMCDFRDFKKSKKLNALLVSVADVEEEADELFFHVMRDMYLHGEEDRLGVFIWDKLFQRLENTADACEHVVDTMRMVMLKNA